LARNKGAKHLAALAQPMQASRLMRGYFGIGVEGISKPMNLGSLLRSAHAFGASFAFTIGAAFDAKAAAQSDTSAAVASMPFHAYDDLAGLQLPHGCRLVGVEFRDDAANLPSFTHPGQAAYVLGAERASLSPELVERCDFLVKIPTKFCVNLAIAGSMVMYDRMISLGRFAERPVRAGGAEQKPAPHVHGEPLWKNKRKRKAGSVAE
jgi:tRNA G18 (ribose-2'-O)-methylase SpoU